MADAPNILAAVKLACRVTSSTFDAELQDLIAAARVYLEEAGVFADVAADDADPQVRHAIKLYALANFGRDNPESEKYLRSFRELVCQMQNSTRYTGRGARV